MHARRRGMALVVGAAVIWGTTGITAKLIFEETSLDPTAVTWLRTLIATPVCLAFAWAALGRRIFAATRRDLGIMAAIGVVLVVCQFCYIAAVDLIGVSVATLVSLCVPPVLVAVVSVLFLGERLTGRALTALLGAVAGTVLLVGRIERGDDGGDWAAGVALALAAAALIAAHILLSRAVAGRQPPWRPVAVTFPVGAVVFAPVGLAGEFTLDLPLPGWLLLLYLAIVPSVLGAWLFQHGLREVPASTASVVTLLEPMVAALLASVIFGERLGPAGWAGAALLLGAIGLLSRGGPARPAIPDVPSPEAARR